MTLWQKRQVLIAFCFGVIFLVAILAVAIFIPSPTEFQIFIFRVILSLAAAGVGAVLPGLLTVEAPPFVRAGGAMALFVIVFWFNPPKLATNFIPFEEALRRAEAALAAGQHGIALSFFQKAQQAKPDSWIPWQGMGRAEYQQGKYAAAFDDFKQAFKLNDKEGTIAYNIALTEEGIGDERQAEQTLLTASGLMPESSEEKLEVLFDSGRIKLLLWIKEGTPSDTQRYNEARSEFMSFLEHGGTPPHWANYYLACLQAYRAEDKTLSESEIKVMRLESTQLLKLAVKQLAEYRSTKAPQQRELMRNLLLFSDRDFHVRPGDPFPCPALIRAWTDETESITNLIASLDQI
jgi:tetratricopeptide (TPR) repeat protein